MTGQARTGILVSLIFHIAAFILFAGVRLYYRELKPKEEVHVSFVNVQNAKLRRRAALIRPMVSISRSPRSHSQNQPIVRNAYDSSEVFYTDAPERVFALAGNVEREGSKIQIITRAPPIYRPERMVNLMGVKSLKETRPLGIQIQPRVASGRDLLREVEPAQARPSLSYIMQRFAQTVRRRIESRKIYPLAARKSMTEGRVGVKMTILEDGRLEIVEITEPSGHTILDNAALESVRRAAPFPPFPEEAERKMIQMSIYLVFKII